MERDTISQASDKKIKSYLSPLRHMFTLCILFVGYRQNVQNQIRHRRSSAASDKRLHCLLTEYFVEI